MDRRSVVSHVIGVLEPLTRAFRMWASDSLSRRVILQVLAKEVPLQAVPIEEGFDALGEGQSLVAYTEDALYRLTSDWKGVVPAFPVLRLARCL